VVRVQKLQESRARPGPAAVAGEHLAEGTRFRIDPRPFRFSTFPSCASTRVDLRPLAGGRFAVSNSSASTNRASSLPTLIRTFRRRRRS